MVKKLLKYAEPLTPTVDKDAIAQTDDEGKEIGSFGQQVAVHFS